MKTHLDLLVSNNVTLLKQGTVCYTNGSSFTALKTFKEFRRRLGEVRSTLTFESFDSECTRGRLKL